MPSLSTENLHLLPEPAALQKHCKSISALEAIICPEWIYRYYSYQSEWSDTEEVCEMRNGEGDQMLILFGEAGVCINGFAHESVMNGWKRLSGSSKASNSQPIQQIYPGVVDGIPTVFHEFIFGEPVKSIGTTFCIWTTGSSWQTGPITYPEDAYRDGSQDLLKLLDGKAMTYKKWAEAYYEDEFEDRALELEWIEKVYAGESISRELALAINPALEDFEQLAADLEEIGYPHKIQE